jgi:hypothetical protein
MIEARSSPSCPPSRSPQAPWRPDETVDYNSQRRRPSETLWEDVMTSRTTGAAFDPTEWSQKAFAERVRIGTNAYVLQGIGYPPAVYL